ncbi:hypothetical protein IT575_11535 [bacterium]|nr:hypothetical protein [bacterium]
MLVALQTSLRRNLRSGLCAALLCALALLLSSCPQKQGGQSAADAPGAAADNGGPRGGLKGGLSPSTVTPPGGDALDKQAEGAAGDAASAEGGAQGGQQVGSAPSQNELAGRWFALYGREGSGMAYYTYMDAKFITLDAEGRLLIEDGQAGPNAALPGRYELADGRLRAYFADARLGSEQLLAGAQPLPDCASAFVLAGSRAVSVDELGLKMDADRQFLAFYDGKGKLTVYGRDDSPHIAGLPGLPGRWQLFLGPRGSYEAELSVDGPELQLIWIGGGGWYKGRFSHGYYVGQGQDAATVFAGALTQSEDGVLNGFYSPVPFVDVRPIFDLKRAPAG